MAATVVHNGEVIETTLGFGVEEAIETATEIVSSPVRDPGARLTTSPSKPKNSDQPVSSFRKQIR
ncbi:hypothetical protein [Halorubrum laminariae]|uniref:Uncharacterized protein n=1 Tax=Halorubrum laminariae TaxID=1433523 RepID=A0ABD6C4K1_9EURY|nr:hypothetical protein [Halorubrum laminariae]